MVTAGRGSKRGAHTLMLDSQSLLLHVIGRWCQVGLHPDEVRCSEKYDGGR